MVRLRGLGFVLDPQAARRSDLTAEVLLRAYDLEPRGASGNPALP
jgi:hypothetical protein